MLEIFNRSRHQDINQYSWIQVFLRRIPANFTRLLNVKFVYPYKKFYFFATILHFLLLYSKAKVSKNGEKDCKM